MTMVTSHIFLLLLAACCRTSQAASCTTCISGSVSQPDHALNIQEPISVETCRDLDSLAFFVDDSSDDCVGIRMMGGLCGCSVPPDACRFCPGGFGLSDPLKELDASLSDVLAAASAGLALNCAFVDSYVQVVSQDDEFCSSTKEIFRQECSCLEAVKENPTIAPNETRFEVCTICPDGSDMGNPEAPIPVEVPDIPVKLETCQDLAAAAAFVSIESDICSESIQVFASFCGCPSLEVPGTDPGCSLCPEGNPPEPYNLFYSVEDNSLGDFFDYDDSYDDSYLKCGFLAMHFQLSEDPDSELCYASQLRREICGCSSHPMLPVYLWSRRVAAIVSVLGSMWIIFNVLKDAKKRDQTYEQIVFCISFFDLISSLAYIFDHFLLPAGISIPGATGNITTCKLQGFLLHLGFSSVFFNLLLAVYFWLSVAKGWKEYQMKKVRRPAYAIVVAIGTATALGGIPFYFPSLITCTFVTPPLEKSWYPLTFFVFFPVGLSLVGIVCFTLALFRSVYRLEQSASKWRMTLRANGDSTTEKVFWRCFWYLMAFLVPWPLYFVHFGLDHTEKTAWFWTVLNICVPIQGFLNALVYRQRSSQNVSSKQKSSRKNSAKVPNFRNEDDQSTEPFPLSRSKAAASSAPL